MKPLLYHPEALDELANASSYFHEHALVSNADELEAELLQALHDLQSDPNLHPEVVPGLRAWRPTKKYQWRIGYTVRKDDIVILAAYYSGAEDPLYWIDRVLP
jgi:hypothetical protein